MFFVTVIVVAGIIYQGTRLSTETEDISAKESESAMISYQDKVIDLLAKQYRDYGNLPTHNLTGNDLRAAYGNALAFYVYGKWTQNQTAIDRGLGIIATLVSQDFNNTDIGWAGNVAQMVKAHAIMKDLPSQDKKKLEDKIKQFTKYNMQDKQSLRMTRASGGGMPLFRVGLKGIPMVNGRIEFLMKVM